MEFCPSLLEGWSLKTTRLCCSRISAGEATPGVLCTVLVSLLEKGYTGTGGRFTRLILELRGLAYEERLSRLGLYSLEFRRMRGDLMETYKIMEGIDKNIT